MPIFHKLRLRFGLKFPVADKYYWLECTALPCQTTSERTNTRSVVPVFTRLQVALNPHRMTPFLLRPNKNAQLLKIIVARTKLTVSSSLSDVNSWHLDKLNKKGQEVINTNEWTHDYSFVRLSVKMKFGTISFGIVFGVWCGWGQIVGQRTSRLTAKDSTNYRHLLPWSSTLPRVFYWHL